MRISLTEQEAKIVLAALQAKYGVQPALPAAQAIMEKLKTRLLEINPYIKV